MPIDKELIANIPSLSPSPPDDVYQKLIDLLRFIIHSPLMDEIVQKSKSPVDDLILKILRLLIK